MNASSAETLLAIEDAITDRGGRRVRQEVYFRCPLPGHHDEHPSARWNAEKRTYYCDVCQRGGGWVELSRLLGVELRGEAHDHDRVVAEYPYRDGEGRLLYVVERWEPKRFLQKRPMVGGGWHYQLGDVPRVLYRLPELRSADPNEPVLVVEGEKDADHLAKLGFIATTNAGGAGKWRDEYSIELRNRDVVILPDHDEPGLRHAEQVALALTGLASSVKVVTL